MDKTKRSLILLNMLEGVGYIRLKALLSAFGTAEEVLNAKERDLLNVKGIGRNISGQIVNAKNYCDIDRELSLIEKDNVDIISIFDSTYPANLKQIYDPPIILYVKGSLKKEDDLAIAIIGSRRCTNYGIRMAEKLGRDLSLNNITIVSGMAKGIDSAAHRGAIEAKGRTIAVLGNGLSYVYPPENKTLAASIAQNGAVISEFAMDMPPHKKNFPQRNRTISGLSKAVIVVEAAAKSGALITADFALEQGREVFAVPGAAGAAASGGTNNLIRQGAKLVESCDDVLDELGFLTKTAASTKTAYTAEAGRFENDVERNIYKFLSDEPCNIDDIKETLSVELKEAKLALLNLEMKHFIRQLPGRLYVRAK